MNHPSARYLLLAMWFTIACPALAQPDTSGMDAGDLERAGIAAIESNSLDDADAYFRAQSKQLPDSFVPWYNLAAVEALRNNHVAAEQHLSKAIAMGFSDLRTLKRDPHLEPIRSRELYQQVTQRWQELLNARRSADTAFAARLVPRNRESRTIDRWKLELISTHTPIATDESEREIKLLADWSTGFFFPETAQSNALNDDPWIMLILPDRAEFARWAIATFGPGARAGISSIGGAYDQNRRRLVAQDLGATLRHELIHVFHWRDMSRLGQEHAAWIQEGLASLVEDYDIEDGTLTPVPSWRTNIVKRQLDAGRLTPIEDLANTQMDRFVASRPLAKYAQSRAVMLFLYDRGQLDAFYNNYTKSFDEDPTGLLALQRTLELEQPEIEGQYRDWLRALPTIAETGTDLPATLGIKIENGTGDGVRVSDLPPGSRQRTGLRVGSFITHINNRPTRDLQELIRVLADYTPGETVTLNHRRGRVYATSEVELLPRK
ncbi:MAG: PDZ domain-containing protein [Phycisphaerales bacterium]